MRSRRALFGDVAFTNAGTGANPLIVGGHHFFQVGVGEDFGRNATCHTRNFRGDAMRHETPSRMTRSEEYGFYAIAERSYKECAQKTHWLFVEENRHRGAIARSPLPHHRTCGSASGGSEGYVKAQSSRGIPRESKYAVGNAGWSAEVFASRHGPSGLPAACAARSLPTPS